MPSVGSTKRTRSSIRGHRPQMEKGRWGSKGTRPLPDQASVQHILGVMITQICRKVLFIQTEVKITLYAVGLFFGSLICDFLPVPKMYLGLTDNIFNLYFVKIGWLWTCLTSGVFIYLTSATYGCGHIDIIRRNAFRLLIATCFWFFWSQWFFQVVDKVSGICLGKAIIKDKRACIHTGFQWHSFDISGHSFLLVYMSLFVVEEAKAIKGWESISNLIRVEDYRRESNPSDAITQEQQLPLKDLSNEEFLTLKENYHSYTPYIRAVFVLLTVLCLISDVMLVCTIIYFHTMPQKVAGGAIAIITWFATYRIWFTSESLSPGLPGSGPFKYQQLKGKIKEAALPVRRRPSITKDSKEVPMFMGMPLYSLKKEKEEKATEDKDEKQCLEETKEPQETRGFHRTDFFSEGRTSHYRR